MAVDHAFERRVKMLVERIPVQMGVMRAALKAPGDRPLFTEQMSKRQAMAFWQEHRDDEMGERILKTMKPEEVMELDTMLAQNRAPEVEPYGGMG